jgi:hypothetical protein
MAETITATHAADSGHWYAPDGKPAYTIIGKNGVERSTTLRDARKLGLVPSVTTILGCASKPQLTNWMIDQNILSCLTLSRNENETEQEYLARIKADAQEQARKARERGTLIHAYVQDWFEGNEVERGSDAYPFCNSANETIFKEVGNQEWTCEKPFATERYGGKADIHNSHYLIDFKTTDKPIADLKLWDDHYLQLAAYRYGLGIAEAKCGILYINSKTAESKLIWAEEKELAKGLKCFNALLDYYYSKTGLGE